MKLCGFDVGLDRPLEHRLGVPLRGCCCTGFGHPHDDLAEIGEAGRSDRQPEISEHDRHALVDRQYIGVHLAHTF